MSPAARGVVVGRAPSMRRTGCRRDNAPMESILRVLRVGVVTGLEPEAAEALLKRARWNVKAAIVMEKAGLTLPQAMKRLRQNDNLVRDAIGEDIEPRLKQLLGI